MVVFEIIFTSFGGFVREQVGEMPVKCDFFPLSSSVLYF